MDYFLTTLVKVLGRILNKFFKNNSFLENNLKSELELLDIPIVTEWDRYQNKLQAELISLHNYNSFLRLDTIRSTMHPAMYGIGYKYSKYLKAQSQKLVPDSLLIEPRLGNPLRQPNLITSSPLNIQHVYHLHEIMRFFEGSITDFDDILEFGGGYGNLCRLIHMLKFQGKYWIKDLPLCGAMQRSYLQRALSNESYSRTNFIEEFSLDQLKGKDFLYIATWSLSETEMYIRAQQEKIIKDSKLFYITFVDTWYGTSIDNLKYFQTLEASMKKTHRMSLSESTIFKNNYTFIGMKT
jgi:putative sugar O-methyltransferase